MVKRSFANSVKRNLNLVCKPFLVQDNFSPKEVFAYVKNMAKDGSFYWVFANITPDYDAHGNISGYFSVRRCPKRSGVNACTDLYRQMLAEEQKAGARDACDASLALLVNVLKQHGVSYEELILSL